MSSLELGRLTKVDLRTVWSHEANSFTPWLAEEDNLALLGDTIGIELELEGTERNVGPFSADILCKDTVNGHWVLIENQLERTDHTHLGQLLTYAAGLNAVTIVWLAARFTEEHRAALDWLNEITSEDINFFGLEVELWRIGDSPIAPKFNVTSKPNDWTKQVASTRRTGEIVSETKQLQLRFWTGLKEVLEEHGGPLTPRKPQPQHWTNYAVGRSGFKLSTEVSMRDQWASVRFRMVGEDAKAHFHLLKRDRDEIETALGFPPSWELKPDYKESSIDVFWDEDPNDVERWPIIYEKMIKYLEQFYRVFAPRIKQLDASEYVFETEQAEVAA